MTSVTVEQKQGTSTHRVRVSAPTIERAIEIATCGVEEARVVFPIDGERFFAPVGNPSEGILHYETIPEEVEDTRKDSGGEDPAISLSFRGG